MPVPLPEMTFRARPGPPTIVRWALDDVDADRRRWRSGSVPVGSVPMKLPWTTLSFGADPMTLIACSVLPEMTLPAPATAPPMVLPLAPLKTLMPPSRQCSAAPPYLRR